MTPISRPRRVLSKTNGACTVRAWKQPGCPPSRSPPAAWPPPRALSLSIIFFFIFFLQKLLTTPGLAPDAGLYPAGNVSPDSPGTPTHLPHGPISDHGRRLRMLETDRTFGRSCQCLPYIDLQAPWAGFHGIEHLPPVEAGCNTVCAPSLRASRTSRRGASSCCFHFFEVLGRFNTARDCNQYF